MDTVSEFACSLALDWRGWWATARRPCPCRRGPRRACAPPALRARCAGCDSSCGGPLRRGAEFSRLTSNCRNLWPSPQVDGSDDSVSAASDWLQGDVSRDLLHPGAGLTESGGVRSACEVRCSGPLRDAADAGDGARADGVQAAQAREVLKAAVEFGGERRRPCPWRGPNRKQSRGYSAGRMCSGVSICARALGTVRRAKGEVATDRP